MRMIVNPFKQTCDVADNVQRCAFALALYLSINHYIDTFTLFLFKGHIRPNIKLI